MSMKLKLGVRVFRNGGNHLYARPYDVIFMFGKRPDDRNMRTASSDGRCSQKTFTVQILSSAKTFQRPQRGMRISGAAVSVPQPVVDEP